MGLLDDAIRDHLELKRLRGADPGEVAREQKEALEPELGGPPAAGEQGLATALEEHGAEDSGETLPVRATPAVTSTSSADPVSASHPAQSESSADVAEETAELDMSSVLEEDAAGEGRSGEDRVAGDSVTDSRSLDPLNEDQLQWEVPGDSSAGMHPDAGTDDS
jgi:hypothetical protein